jgi:hypothetical protein
MAGRAEPLRLFDLADESGALASRGETTASPSINGKRSEASPNETPTPAVQLRGTGVEALGRIAEAATLVCDAQRELDEAIEIARALGHTWRTIGVASGIPFQTLHRRHRHQAGHQEET